MCVATVVLWIKSEKCFLMFDYSRFHEDLKYDYRTAVHTQAINGLLMVSAENTQDRQNFPFAVDAVDTSVHSSGEFGSFSNDLFHNHVYDWTWHGFAFTHRSWKDDGRAAQGPQNKFRGFFTFGNGNRVRSASYGVTCPLWLVVTVFLVLPIMWLWRRLRSAPARGCCKRCGYDLRATPTRCPECGSSIGAERVGVHPISVI